MISNRRREYSTREIVSALPKEQRAQFLALDRAERALLINGTPEEKEHYGWLPGGAAKRYAQLSEAERIAEARDGKRARVLERQAPVAAAAKPVEVVAPGLCDSSARVAESVRDIFELPEGGIERVQSIAVNWMQRGSSEDEALDRLSELLMDETPLPAGVPPPSRMQVMFGAGNVLRG